MSEAHEPRESHWTSGALPPNVRVGVNTRITGGHAFRRFASRLDPGLTLGDHCTMDGVHFSVGVNGRIDIGDYCYFTNAILLCEQAVHIGNYVLIGWSATIADSDFHPVGPADRIADAFACSPLGRGKRRPEIACRPIVIEDAAWIGPHAAILKGVRIGEGAFVEPGAVVTRDVPARSRVIGNPARIIGQV